MDIVKIKTAKIEPNKGQIEGLPKNPRQWTKGDVERLARSLEETPELFEARPVLVVPHGDKYVALGGNLRLEGAKRNGLKEVPCIIFDAGTDVEKMKEIVIKDNGSFGSWDFDDLANEWDNGQLTEWGVPVWDAEQATEGNEENTAQEDNFYPEDEEIHVICKYGDVWQLGEHRLMCGDSIELADIQKLMGGAGLTSY